MDENRRRLALPVKGGAADDDYLRNIITDNLFCNAGLCSDDLL